MQEKNTFLAVLIVALLVTGNLIGAGILALPIQTGLAGYIPSIVGMVVLAIAMLSSAIILGKEAILKRDPKFNYPSLYQNYLGKAGKWIAIAANVLILYGLLTAYLTGATTIIKDLFHLNIPETIVLLAVFTVMTSMVINGIGTAGKLNAIITVLMFASFILIITVAGKHVDTTRFRHVNWFFLASAAPVMVTAFHFHNIIPNICESLKWNFTTVWKTMLAGIIIGFIMNMVWVTVSIGAIPLSGGNVSILAAFKENMPATVPLAEIINSGVFITGSLLFALLAIFTSFIANSLGLVGFITDLTENHFHVKSRFLVMALAFGPPLVISAIFPDIFLVAINVVGGVGIVVLFGILPSIIAMKRAKSSFAKTFAAALLVLFSVCLAAEIGQQTHLLKIDPEAEYWKAPVAQVKIKK